MLSSEVRFTCACVCVCVCVCVCKYADLNVCSMFYARECVLCVCVGVCLSVNIIYMCVCVCVGLCAFDECAREREVVPLPSPAPAAGL